MSQPILAPAARRGSTRIAGGRRLAWAEWGPEAGVPVLFCPGAGMSPSLGFGADALDELGVRLIALARPGLGDSDPAPERTLASWAEDVRSFCAARALEAPPVVGFSQGAPFVLACAADGVVARAAVVSGTDELAAPELREALVPDVAALVDRATTDPAGAEALFRSAGTSCSARATLMTCWTLRSGRSFSSWTRASEVSDGNLRAAPASFRT